MPPPEAWIDRPAVRWTMGTLLALLILGVPLLHHRMTYVNIKRLRVATPGKVYRSGCMTASGFEDTIRKYGIRTVLNLQEEDVDPNLPRGFFDRSREKESELCDRLDVDYRLLQCDLVHPLESPRKRPEAIDRFLELMDEVRYPVLIHCRAGLHRTGCLLAVYRMEYEGWTPLQALRELKGLGFGETKSTSANDYITQYVLTYRPRRLAGSGPVVPAAAVSRPLPMGPEDQDR